MFFDILDISKVATVMSVRSPVKVRFQYRRVAIPEVFNITSLIISIFIIVQI